ncbi:MAG: hypothetical protein IRY85_11615 [Micromonosporaceae bacterium]|nr:hypothetical protein [Micromonosporaceae bacterium]
MAIIIDFEKVGETSREVEYAFGEGGRMDRRLTIDKQSHEASPADGTRDKSFSSAYGAILHDRERLGHWPIRGGRQS